MNIKKDYLWIKLKYSFINFELLQLQNHSGPGSLHQNQTLNSSKLLQFSNLFCEKCFLHFFLYFFSHCVQAHLTGARMNLCISIPIRGILRASRALILLIWHKNRSQQFEYSKPCLVLCKCFHIKNKLIYYTICERGKRHLLIWPLNIVNCQIHYCNFIFVKIHQIIAKNVKRKLWETTPLLSQIYK